MILTETLKVADLFCGAGGFDMGAKLALADLGIESDLLAVNHWQTAIDTHALNHPDARRVCVDVYKIAPLDAIPGGRLDLLMASPTCVYYSRARGGAPVSWDQRWGRMTPSQVLRWVTDLDVRVLLVENVPEFREWGPVCKRTTQCAEHGWDGPTPKRELCGKPLRKKRGTYFRAWIRRLQRLGYRLEHRVLNAADYGDATTRSRFFLIARKDGAPIEWPEPTHARDASADLFGPRKRWVAARTAIDWRIKGRSIFRRKKPLAAKTLLRIYAGLIRFQWPLRFVVKLERYMRSLGIFIPERLAIRASTAQALVVRSGMHKSNALCVRSADDPLATVTSDGGLAVVEPFVFPANQGTERVRGLRSVEQPLDTVVARDFKGLVEPLLIPQGSNSVARGVSSPVPTIVAIPRTGLVEPFVLNRHGDNNGATGSQRGHSIEEPLPTPTASGAGYVVEPFVLSQGAGGAPRSVEEPVPSIPTDGAHALLAAYYGTGSCKSVEEPLDTVTTKARFGLVVPVTHHDSSNRSRSVDDPLPTITSAHRGELAFVTAQFGEREGQAARVQTLDRPLPTLCAEGRVPLYQGRNIPSAPAKRGFAGSDLEGLSLEDALAVVAKLSKRAARKLLAFYADVDILFRMLEPQELARAMGFPERYRIEGTKEERTRMVGNAVPVNTARALVAAIVRSGLAVAA